MNPIQKHAQHGFQLFWSTETHKLSVNFAANEPVWIVLVAMSHLVMLNLRERDIFQVCVFQINKNLPAWMIQSFYFDAVAMLPISITLRVIPALNLSKDRSIHLLFLPRHNKIAALLIRSHLLLAFGGAAC